MARVALAAEGGRLVFVSTRPPPWPRGYRRQRHSALRLYLRQCRPSRCARLRVMQPPPTRGRLPRIRGGPLSTPRPIYGPKRIRHASRSAASDFCARQIGLEPRLLSRSGSSESNTQTLNLTPRLRISSVLTRCTSLVSVLSQDVGPWEPGPGARTQPRPTLMARDGRRARHERRGPILAAAVSAELSSHI